MNKTLLKNFATQARVRLMQDVRYRLGLMGITEKGIAAPVHQTLDMESYEYARGQTFSLHGREVAARKHVASMVRARGFEQTVEEVAYTWFNRLIAIRFMEVNDYLPHHTRVLSSATPGQSVPDIVSRALDIDLGLNEAEQQQVLAWKLDNQTDELFRFLFLKQCRQLAGLLPGLFDGQHAAQTDHLSLLLTISCVNPDGIVAELLKIPESYFDVNAVDEEGQPIGQIEIIGWLYQYYNAELKDDTFARLKKNIKIAKERIPAATQLFTPQWIVKYMVENSLGRLWVEKLLADGDPRSEKEIAESFGWCYYLPEAEQEPQVVAQLKAMRKERQLQSPEDIRFIDPCMGSGHILVYAFDVLMQVYLSRGYGASEAARLIVQKNLYGLDIDDRAWQLAYFAVMMKARQHRPQALLEGLVCNLHAVQDSQGLENKQLDYFGQGLSSLERNMARDQAEELLHLFRDGKLLGSIIRVPDWDFELLRRFARDFKLPRQVDLLSDLHAERAQPWLMQLVEIARILQQQYDAVVTNPPYMGSGGMSPALSSYVKEEYPDSKADLFAVFIERCGQMLKQTGYQAMITQHAWMFLSSYEKLRNKLHQQLFITMAHLGARAFEEVGGEVVQTTAFVLGKKVVQGYQGTYARLIEPTTQGGKEEMFLKGENSYTANQQNFLKIPGAPVAYWASSEILKAFSCNPLNNIGQSRKGMATGLNEEFVRHWYEVALRKIKLSTDKSIAHSMNFKWFPYANGGMYRKWFGNILEVVNWENNGHRLKTELHEDGHRIRAVNLNLEYVFLPGIVWTSITSSDTSMRYLPENHLFSSASNAWFSKDRRILPIVLGFLNTKVRAALMGIYNPTLNANPNDVGNLPFIKEVLDNQTVSKQVCQSIMISKSDWNDFETSWDFKIHPIVSFQRSEVIDQTILKQTTDHCSLITDHFQSWKQETLSRFAQLKANEEELNRIFIDIYSLQDELSPEVADKDVTVYRIIDEPDEEERKMRYVLSKRDAIITLISYAVGCMLGRYSLDVEGLAFAGGEWDENKYSNFIPDADSILPITDEEYFTDDIVSRFVDWVRVAYGQATLEENLRFVAEALGGNGTPREVIRNYFLKDFYKDHVRTYKKRPIYWLFDSGRQDGFKALIYMHRYDRDTLGRVRVDYLHRLQAAYENAIQGCDRTIDSATTAAEKGRATRRKEKLQRQLEECKVYDQALAHLAGRRIAIDLDDGVKHNYALFQGVELAREGRRAVKVDLLSKI